jgi:hypothetical protein
MDRSNGPVHNHSQEAKAKEGKWSLYCANAAYEQCMVDAPQPYLGSAATLFCMKLPVVGASDWTEHARQLY